jgi:hypothetical protein
VTLIEGAVVDLFGGGPPEEETVGGEERVLLGEVGFVVAILGAVGGEVGDFAVEDDGGGGALGEFGIDRGVDAEGLHAAGEDDFGEGEVGVGLPFLGGIDQRGGAVGEGGGGGDGRHAFEGGEEIGEEFLIGGGEAGDGAGVGSAAFGAVEEGEGEGGGEGGVGGGLSAEDGHGLLDRWFGRVENGDGFGRGGGGRGDGEGGHGGSGVGGGLSGCGGGERDRGECGGRESSGLGGGIDEGDGRHSARSADDGAELVGIDLVNGGVGAGGEVGDLLRGELFRGRSMRDSGGMMEGDGHAAGETCRDEGGGKEGHTARGIDGCDDHLFSIRGNRLVPSWAGDCRSGGAEFDDELLQIASRFAKAGLVGEIHFEDRLTPAGGTLEAPASGEGEHFLRSFQRPELEFLADGGIGHAAVGEFPGFQHLVQPGEDRTGGRIFYLRIERPEFVNFFQGCGGVAGGEGVDHVPDLLLVLEADEGVDRFAGDGGGVGFVEGELGEFIVEALEVGADEVGEELGGGGFDVFVVAFLGAFDDPGGDLEFLDRFGGADGADLVEGFVEARGFEPGVEDQDEGGGFGGGFDIVFEDFAVGEAAIGEIGIGFFQERIGGVDDDEFFGGEHGGGADFVEDDGHGFSAEGGGVEADEAHAGVFALEEVALDFGEVLVAQIELFASEDDDGGEGGFLGGLGHAGIVTVKTASKVEADALFTKKKACPFFRMHSFLFRIVYVECLPSNRFVRDDAK